MRPLAKGLLSTSLLVGALFDAVFALAILYAPAALARLLGLRLPAETVYLDLAAVLLLILALFYLVAAFRIESLPALASVAAAGRLLGFLFFLSVWHSGHPDVFLGFGVADLSLAIAHAGFLVWALWESPVGGVEPA